MSKSITTLIFFIILAASAMIKFRSFDRPYSIVQHRFFHTKNTQILGYSYNSDLLDSIIAHSFLVPATLREVGYGLRWKTGATPPWIFAQKDPLDSKKYMLLLREEILPEFETPSSKKMYQESASIAQSEIERLPKTLSTFIMPVPTKIYANQLIVTSAEAEEIDRKKYGLNKSAIYVGAKRSQLSFESLLASKKINVLSLIPTYENLRSSKYPLYPNGESHWGHRLINELGPSIITSIINRLNLDNACFVSRSESEAQKPGLVITTGDLIGAMGIDNDSIFSKSMTSVERIDPVIVSYKIADTKCPTIIYVGTSYGRVFEGHGDITQSLQSAYRGRVENYSISGKGPRFPLDQFLATVRSDATGILIWEFPFRDVKKMSLVLPENN